MMTFVSLSIFCRSSSNGFFTDSHWRCTTLVEGEWTSEFYDYSSWSNAYPESEFSASGYTSNQLRNTFGVYAKFIWYFDDNFDGKIYCRAKLEFGMLTVYSTYMFVFTCTLHNRLYVRIYDKWVVDVYGCTFKIFIDKQNGCLHVHLCFAEIPHFFSNHWREAGASTGLWLFWARSCTHVDAISGTVLRTLSGKHRFSSLLYRISWRNGQRSQFHNFSERELWSVQRFHAVLRQLTSLLRSGTRLRLHVSRFKFNNSWYLSWLVHSVHVYYVDVLSM